MIAEFAVFQNGASQPWWQSSAFGTAVIAVLGAIAYYFNDKKVNALKASSDEQKQTIDATHVLVNSGMGAQLRTGLTSAQALYASTKSPEHFQLLQEAQKALDDHNARQAAADASVKK